MMRYRTWMNVAPDGTIISTVWQLDRPGGAHPPGHPVLCVDREHEHELRKNAGKNLHYAKGCVRRRQSVRWSLSSSVAAVGETVRLALEGLPEDYRAPICVQVGEDKYVLEHPYQVELGWKNAAHVSVQVVDEPALAQHDFVKVQFVERRRKP